MGSWYSWVLLQFIWPHVGYVLQHEFVNIEGVLIKWTWPQVGVLLGTQGLDSIEAQLTPRLGYSVDSCHTTPSWGCWYACLLAYSRETKLSCPKAVRRCRRWASAPGAARLVLLFIWWLTIICSWQQIIVYRMINSSLFLTIRKLKLISTLNPQRIINITLKVSKKLWQMTMKSWPQTPST